ncbi:hypothetical protein HJA83_09850 [Rhizobium bangladeshense]|uniref:ribbon-helix-helix domain-containing protein n=1 Tax=Rhizobium bangladeshense TaxID=1138189 RepID=UPI001C8362AA|nr:ribbon-helix-helix domain-containing protein [Rhizobium bangladeshense]MBX4901637.1 hypothetical protein [Rhizobium bangladeshense]
MKELQAHSKPVHRRIGTTFTESELDQIDEWGFSRRIRDRSEAIRRLVSEALKAEVKTATD